MNEDKKASCNNDDDECEDEGFRRVIKLASSQNDGIKSRQGDNVMVGASQCFAFRQVILGTGIELRRSRISGRAPRANRTTAWIHTALFGIAITV